MHVEKFSLSAVLTLQVTTLVTNTHEAITGFQIRIVKHFISLYPVASLLAHVPQISKILI